MAGFVWRLLRPRLHAGAVHTLDAATSADINFELEELLSSIGDEDFAAATTIAERMLGTLKGISPG